MAQQPRESTFCSWRGLECASQPPIGQLTITWNPSLGGSDTSGLLGGSGAYTHIDTHITKIIKFQEKIVFLFPDKNWTCNTDRVLSS